MGQSTYLMHSAENIAMIARPQPLCARGKDLVAYPEGVRSAIFALSALQDT